ncbi:hypothetical protein Esi_0115_0046 [Ectocarpus siliculosus]|uniref:C2 domain-containing protein n=1 Tax=Ectocarpus siliculosus TaxID=2880 RepID=D7FHZ2_ECTSI|nr:hypothetical protein Esi_0115_0046 [Ectocarpus siliculosus]|eukprot:CBJ49003.1 hypothetical protein Esi_0115_0046 [Ectocarpus siliculosus]
MNFSVSSGAGQTRELVVKQAERVARHTLVADISKLEERISDDEREYEAKAAERQKEQRRKEQELKEAAIQNVVSGASSKLSGNLFDRMQGLAKLHESAKSAMKFELGQLANVGKGAGKATPANGGSSTSVHRHKTLKDDDLVPDDSVDNGEQEEVEDVLGGEGLDLSYLWVVDAGKVLSRSNKSTSDTEGSSHTAKGGTTTDSEQEAEQRRPGDDRVSGNGDAEGVENEQGSGAHAAKKEGDGRLPLDKASGKKSRDATNGGGENLVGSLELGDGGGENAQPSIAQVDTKAEKRARNTEKRGEAGGGRAGDNGDARPEQPQVKKRKGRLVPGSLVLTSVSAADLPDTEKGVFSKQDPYLVARWGEQEVRTSAKRDSGKACSWVKEEVALLVRTKKQLQEPIEIEVWNDNAGDKKPSPDVLIGKGSLPVKHLASADPAAPPHTTGGGGGSSGGGGGGSASAGVGKRRNRGGDGDERNDNYTDDEGGSDGGVVVTVALVPGDRRARKKNNATAGVVTLTLAYTPPRRKPPRATNEQEAAEAAAAQARREGDRTATETDDDALSSIAGLSAWSIQGKRNHLSVQELGAVMSQTLEGFNIREELGKIEFVQGIINEGFGQRGAFAYIQEEHLVGHPIYAPRGARKRLLALAELIRLQMRAEKEKVTAVEDIAEDGSPFWSPALERGYTTDGVAFFDTLAAMNYSLEEDRAKLELTKTNEFTTQQQDAPPQPKPPKPRSAAKEKVDVWLDHADRFKNGAIPREAVKTVIRDALLLNGLPSPRESDAKISLQHASTDDQGLRFDRSKLGVELEHLIRRELFIL